MQVESFHSVEQVHYLILFLRLHETCLIFLWWEVFELEVLSICKQTDNSTPVFSTEVVHRVMDLKRHSLISNLSSEGFFAYISSLRVLWILVLSILKETHCIFDADVVCDNG